MKTTFVSTSALHNSVRLAMQRSQRELSDATTEMTTGRHADVGIALGSQSATSVSLTRTIEHLKTMQDTNALAQQRLTVSQEALELLSANGQTMLETMITLGNSGETNNISIAKRDLVAALDSFASIANTSSAGEFVFAGINTDVRPITAYADGSAAQTDFQALFTSTFGFPSTDPQTANITSAQMESFLADVEAMFMDTAAGGYWATNWSDASDTNVTSRIGKSEIIETSTNSNTEGFRRYAMVAVVGVELLELSLGTDTRQAMSSWMITQAGSAIGQIDSERAQLGVSEQRVTRSSKGLEDQRDVLSLYLTSLESVDLNEAAVRVNTLETQLQAAYTLTGRLQNMSLLNYL
jgi:flagellar hook-associated protein 3 FlgL